MKRLAIVLILSALTLCGCKDGGVNGENAATAEAEQSSKERESLFGIEHEELYSVIGKIKSGETFGGILTRLGLPAERHSAVMAAADGIFDPRKIRSGNSY